MLSIVYLVVIITSLMLASLAFFIVLDIIAHLIGSKEK